MRCGACGTRLSQSSHPGGAGAPPGPITRSCQELADDRLAYSTVVFERDAGHPLIARGEKGANPGRVTRRGNEFACPWAGFALLTPQLRAPLLSARLRIIFPGRNR